MSTYLSSFLWMPVVLLAFAASGQPWGFQTMVNTLLHYDVDTMDVQGLAAKIAEGGTILLDARGYDEYRVSHLKGALHVGYDALNEQVLHGLDPNAEIVVYCSVGKRSEDVARIMRDRGFTQVYNLWGGLFDWVNQGGKIVDENGKDTNQVHPYNRIWGIWLTNCEKTYEPR